MRCPYCNSESSKVVDSRPAEENNSIRRRRQCESCKKRFTTYEKIETVPLMVIKKDRTRVPFNREKVMNGIVRSCHKRPVSISQIEKLVDEIENNALNSFEKEIESQVIGKLVMEGLKKLDQIAYVRFASVYREFKDIQSFMVEIKKMTDSQV